MENISYYITQKFIKLENDVNGNPRYYIGLLECADLLEVGKEWLQDNRKKLKLLSLYRGKKYGFGFVVSSYNLLEDVANMKKNIILQLKQQNKF